ncbi:MAG TPA: DegT/DnrJ/EryC1/StrS family aminotransferase [Burkholderiales bacterium]|nr:DegT/DnrJ/EryC1/StrS family aminotransferase [Burkholderiales bacterium]
MSELRSDPIPMLDLKAEYALFEPALTGALLDVLQAGQFVLGPQGQALEREIAHYCGAEHGIGVANGTDAIHLVLRALGIGPGDEVILPSFTFIGSAEPINYCGAKPVFVDIDPLTFNVDPSAVERAINARTRALIAVHLFGQCADLAQLKAICDRHAIALVEDCAQSIGADFAGRRCASWGAAGCFSFYPSKNLGAYGDAGMIVTRDAKLAEEIRVLRNHGSRTRYHHHVIGYNCRLDEMQAAILRVKLQHLDRLNALRRDRAMGYNQRLIDADIITPHEHGNGTHVYHQYTIRSRQRDAIRAALDAEKIGSMIYYPIPLHKQDVYESDHRLTLPHSEAAAAEVLSLPMFPMLNDAQLDRICDVIKRSLA